MNRLLFQSRAWLLGSLASTVLLLDSCNMYADPRPCSVLSYLPGEHYQVQISELVSSTESSCLSIATGTSFEFEVAETSEARDGCARSALVDEVPEFLRSEVDRCGPAGDLKFTCNGNNTSLSIQMVGNPSLESAIAAKLVLSFGNSMVSCVDEYEVEIEGIAASSDSVQ